MKADLIITADIHARPDQPECRKDDYQKAQRQAFRFLKDLQVKHDCPVAVAGDIFDKWHQGKETPYLISEALKYMPDMLAIPGQHDISSHRTESFAKSALYVLQQAKRVKICLPQRSQRVGTLSSVYGHAFGQELKNIPPKAGKRQVLMCHTLVCRNKDPFPGAHADKAKALLKKLRGFDLIVSGDNHEPFVVEHKGRLLVNPGSLMRMTAKQIEHRPRVYLWYEATNTVKAVYLPIRKGVISREHIEKVEEKEKRIDAFVSRLGVDMEVGLSFGANMKKFLKQNKINKGVRCIIREVCEV